MFKQNLLKLMQEKNMTLKELSFRTGISTGVLSSYIDNRENIPNVLYGVEIAAALDTTVEFLVTGTKKRKCLICDYFLVLPKLQKLSRLKFEIISKLVDILLSDD